jgi:predicted RNA-binding protein YlxR (DUF448 family)
MDGMPATPPPPPPERLDRRESPLRRCIVTGEVRDRGALLRFVVGPDGAIVPDIEARLPGRGLWLTPRRDIVERAVAKRLFARAARRAVSAPPDLADRIESLLARRCYDAIGLARRAGLAVAGFERVGDAVRRGQVGLLLAALDGAEGGHRKLTALGRDLPSARVLTAAELGGAFGRERTVHAAVAGGPLCRRLLLDLTRLVGLRAAAAVDLRADLGVDRGMDFAPAGPASQDGGTEAHD